MPFFPHSANHHYSFENQNHLFGAGEILVAAGRIRRPSKTAQRNAGSAIDLNRVAYHRRNGDLNSARARLEFARAARLALS